MSAIKNELTRNRHSKSAPLTQYPCPCCGSGDISVFYELRNLPVQSVLLIPTREDALNYPKANMTLGFCQICGFIFNLAFDLALLDYSDTYESTQAFSPIYNDFAYGLASRLIEQYGLRNKTVLEIGCGNGEFLTLLCDLGSNQGIGFDPAYVDERADSKAGERLTFIKDYYSEKYSNYRADFICCKMTLEHIQDTDDFVSTIRRAIEDRHDTIVFFQVPDVTRILRDCGFEDIYYEHCSYFSPGSLARLLRRCGFDLLHLETAYDGQYLMIEAKPAIGKPLPHLSEEEDLEKLRDYVARFPEKFQSKVSTWRKQLNEIYQNDRRAVLWGSGSKGVAFLSTLNIYDEIEYVVDINPHRQGTYMAGTGQEIVGPEFLKEYQPDVVIIMNAVYQNEIEQDLKRMGSAPEILTP
jgi:SAM-dependent methyltransferase